MPKQTNLHCSFCGRGRDEVKILIAGQEGHICENCVEHAQDIITQELGLKQEGNSTPSGANASLSAGATSNFKLNIRKPFEIKKIPRK